MPMAWLNWSAERNRHVACRVYTPVDPCRNTAHRRRSSVTSERDRRSTDRGDCVLLDWHSFLRSDQHWDRRSPTVDGDGWWRMLWCSPVIEAHGQEESETCLVQPDDLDLRPPRHSGLTRASARDLPVGRHSCCQRRKLNYEICRDGRCKRREWSPRSSNRWWWSPFSIA